MDTNTLKTKIEELESKLKTAEKEKIKAEENLKIAKERKQEVIEKMKEYDVTPETISAKIDELKASIEKTINDITERLPEV